AATPPRRWRPAAAGYSSRGPAQGPLQATTTPPSPTTAERSLTQPALAAGWGPLDGPRAPGQERRLHGKPLDRTTTNSWEAIEFLQAVRATGRRKLILCALWTEICMAFTALDALREGYEVYPVVDAIGGTSPEAPPGA